MSHNSVGDRTD